MNQPEFWYPLASQSIGEEEIAAAVSVLRSGRTTMGDRVAAFEEEFARYVGAPHAVMVNSGSSADLLIAYACDQAFEVLVPAVTWPTQVWPWRMLGANVRLVDIGGNGLNVTAETLEAARTSNTGLVNIVHLLGVPCDMDAICRWASQRCLTIMEDCCEALGSEWDGRPVGSFGHAAAWSFFFSHHMTTMEGGMVTTASASFAGRLRMLRSHGWARDYDKSRDGRYTFVDWGFNVRPTEVAAAIGSVQLSRLDETNRLRNKNRDTFVGMLRDNEQVTFPLEPAKGHVSWFGLPMFLDSNRTRNRLAVYLEERGVETRPILAGNLANQPAANRRRLSHGPLPGADFLDSRGLYVGLHADKDPAPVAELVDKFL